MRVIILLLLVYIMFYSNCTVYPRRHDGAAPILHTRSPHCWPAWSIFPIPKLQATLEVSHSATDVGNMCKTRLFTNCAHPYVAVSIPRVIRSIEFEYNRNAVVSEIPHIADVVSRVLGRCGMLYSMMLLPGWHEQSEPYCDAVGSLFWVMDILSRLDPGSAMDKRLNVCECVLFRRHVVGDDTGQNVGVDRATDTYLY